MEVVQQGQVEAQEAAEPGEKQLQPQEQLIPVVGAVATIVATQALKADLAS